MVKTKKSAKKFQRTQLKGTIERRRKHQKLKRAINQRKERRANKQTKNNNEDKEPKNPETSDQLTFPEPTGNVDDYFCGFVIESDERLDLSDDEESDLAVLSEFKAVEAEDEDMTDHDEKSPPIDSDEDDENEDNEEDEFDVEDDEYEEIEEDEDETDEDEDDDEDSDEDMDEDDSECQVVSKELLDKWVAEATKMSPDALKHLLMAFRSVVRSDDDTSYSYQVNNSKVYKKLVKSTFQVTYPIFSQHVVTTKKVRHPAKTKLWPKFEKPIRVFINSSVRFLQDLTQESMIIQALDSLDQCVTYFGCFPKAAREYLRVLLDRWSDPACSEAARERCYKSIRLFAEKAVTIEKKTYLAHALKGVYLVFAKRATKINESSLPVIQQMAQDAGDLYSIDPRLGFQHASVYIRQLADHFKKTKKSENSDKFKAIYTWQYVNCLDFWSTVLGVTCEPTAGSAMSLQTLVTPLVDLILQTIRLNEAAHYLPLRVHLLRTLISFIDATGFYIPLAPYLFDIFSGSHKLSTENSGEPFSWDLHLKVPKALLNTKSFQNAVYQVFYDSVVDFYACFGMSIAFPELAIPALAKLKEDMRRLKGTRFAKPLKTLIEKLETHKNYIEQKRSPIEYSATKLDEANAFLRNVAFESTPFGNFLMKKSQQTA